MVGCGVRYNRYMAGNSFGQLFRITTAGESHGDGNVVIIDGCPPGLSLRASDLETDLNRRRPGQSSIVSQRDEADVPEILSGVFEGKTTGTSIAILVRNRDQRSRDYEDIKNKYRPGHADQNTRQLKETEDNPDGNRNCQRGYDRVSPVVIPCRDEFKCQGGGRCTYQ